MQHAWSPTDLQAYQLAEPITLFALDASGLNNQTIGVRSAQGEFIWKRYQPAHDLAALRYEHQLLAQLAACVLPFATPIPLPTPAGATLTHIAHGWQALFWRLPGIPAQKQNLQHVSAVGAALAQLHLALAVLPALPHPRYSSYAALGQVHPHMPQPAQLVATDFEMQRSDPQLLALWQAELQALEGWIQHRYGQLPQQLIHGDFACANTLWHQDRISAMIDFEFAAPDVRALDLAALLDLIACPWEGPPRWELIVAAYRGYTSVLPLSAPEQAALPWLMRLRGAVSTIWWIGRSRVAAQPCAIRKLDELQARVHWLAVATTQLSALEALSQRSER